MINLGYSDIDFSLYEDDKLLNKYFSFAYCYSSHSEDDNLFFRNIENELLSRLASVNDLKLENEQLKNQIQELNNKISFMSFSRKYGPKLKYKKSSSGRKNKLSDEDVEKILNSTLPYRALAVEFSCSIGLISKIKNSVHK